MGTSVEDVYDSDWLLQTTVVNKGASILLDGVDSGIVSIYSVTGVLIGSEVVDVYNSQIVAPSKTGFYIVQIKTEDRYYVYKIWVR